MQLNVILGVNGFKSHPAEWSRCDTTPCYRGVTIYVMMTFTELKDTGNMVGWVLSLQALISNCQWWDKGAKSSGERRNLQCPDSQNQRGFILYRWTNSGGTDSKTQTLSNLDNHRIMSQPGSSCATAHWKCDQTQVHAMWRTGSF